MSGSQTWMIRAGNDNELIEQFTTHNWVAIGWPGLGNLSDVDSREAVKERYREAYEKHSDGKRAVNAGQLYRFANVMEPGDLVLSYDKSSREYLVGYIDGPYEFNPEEADDSYPHIRPVDWNDERIDRDQFSNPAKNTLGGTMTVFSLDDIRNEINEVLAADSVEQEEITEEEDDTPPFHVDVASKANERISDLVAHVDDERFEDLVAAVLRAMDYESMTTSAGADHGVDVLAHPDAFGFDDPMIKVQVKHRNSKTGSSDMRDFIGTLGGAEKGLFVSTGGYTCDAEEEAKRTDRRVTLLDRDDFIDLLLEDYNSLETEYTNLIPLKQVYVPTEEP